MNKAVEIDMRVLLTALVRKIWLVILCAVLLGAATFAGTKVLITPRYQASVSVYVNSIRTNADGSTATLTYTDLNTAQRLVSTYVNILTSDRVLTSVASELNTELSPEQIRPMITAEPLNNTEVFQVMVSNTDPVLAAEIANAIAHVAPEEIAQIVTGSATKIIDYAKVPTEPYAPNTIRNTMLGVLGGILLAVVIVVLQVMLDVRIHDETDLAKLSDAPILGRIPNFDQENGADGYGHTGKYEQTDKAVRR